MQDWPVAGGALAWPPVQAEEAVDGWTATAAPEQGSRIDGSRTKRGSAANTGAVRQSPRVLGGTGRDDTTLEDDEG